MVIKERMWYQPANEYRTVHIYLPDNYSETDERYPVMYFFDGHNLFFDEDATYGKSWGLKTFMDQWEKKMIVVGVECSHHGNHRLSEYCPYPTAAFGANITGEGAETMDWYVEVLKPYIDKKYRTYPFREATGICGSSMGGLMAMFAGSVYNYVFSKAACVSSAIGIVKHELFTEMRNAFIDPDSRFYISWGEHESRTDGNPEYEGWTAVNNRAAQRLLDEKGAITRLYYQPDGYHCEADWEKQVELFMNFLWLDK